MDPLLVSLLSATEAAPSDVTLRLHLVELLRDRDEHLEALRHCAAALAVSPESDAGRAIMRDLLRDVFSETIEDAAATEAPDPQQSQEAREQEPAASDPVHEEWWAERVNVTLADIGGMEVAKERLQAAVLAPMRNPELRRLYRKSRSGGVLLYGPHGCGKTFLVRATAGELDARFLSLRFADIPAEHVEQEIHAAFAAAREQAPVVLYLDGIEHLGRDGIRRDGVRSRAVTALIGELDNPGGGVTVMGSSEAPWDVDPALRRQGRIEQTLLVLPPDRTTREVILHQYLGDHPDVEVAEIARFARGYSGADLVAAIRVAESRETSITTAGLREALTEQVPSARGWLAAARRELDAYPDPGAFIGLREYLSAVERPSGG
ncbi:MAG: ATP-binding protein [Mobilicoccus sp.]|nr:ATP-binding protein [Mobilicoccus sp.]